MLSFFLQANALGALQLELYSNPLSPAEINASQQLLRDAQRHLPPVLIQRLDQKISVIWKAELPESIYGRARSGTLELNAQLLKPLLTGEAHRLPGTGQHPNRYQSLVVTVLHELTHLYDRAQIWPAHARTQYRFCQQQQGRLGTQGLAESCQSKASRRLTLSDDPIFLELAGWTRQAGAPTQHTTQSHQNLRSPDSYEYSDAQEFLAVNLEYFLLDPEYACRRPSLYRYFQQHFDWHPFTVQCAADYPILNAGKDFSQSPFLRLNPERVYQVDYLLAEGNEEWVSRWGHSMLRLVICAPKTPMGPKCRLDLEHHLVLSFRAFVEDVQLSSWDGLIGQYPSRLFILPLDQVVEEYTRMELRSLSSVPLKLSRAQIQHMVERSVELHWEYDGDYYFLSNNCAVETLNLLRSGTQHPALSSLDSIMPNGLLTLMEVRGVADPEPLQNPQEALRLGYRFDSYRERYVAMFQVIKKQLPMIPQSTFEDWLQARPEQRQHWFQQGSLPTLAAMLLLEQGAYHRQLLHMRDEIKQRYFNGHTPNDSSFELANANLQALLMGSGYLSKPAELLDSHSYGIPQAQEVQEVEHKSQARQQQLKQLEEQLDQHIRALLAPEAQQTLAGIEHNLALIGVRLRSLHQAQQGWKP